MRQLRVVGLSDDGETVIVEDPIRHERFSVPGDERLRAAARGDVRRLGQMEIEHTSPLRPRDIQARVRAGESVEQIADGGGVTVGHVERFAYPVLLERARVAEMAGRAHPLTSADPQHPDPRTLGEIVAATFVARGQDYDDARWDAWKGDDAQWRVVLSWRAGRSDNTASWTFRPGAGGGVVSALDDPARELIGDPSEAVDNPWRVDGAHRASTSGPPGPASSSSSEAGADPEPVEPALDGEQEAFEDVPPALAASGDAAPTRRASSRRATSGASGTGSGGHGATGTTASSTARGTRGSRAGARPSRGVPDQRDHRERREERREHPRPEHPRPENPRPENPRSEHPRPDQSRPERQTAVERATTAPPNPPSSGGTDTPDDTRGTENVRGKARRNHPIVPSWEDVLLGTRSPRT